MWQNINDQNSKYGHKIKMRNPLTNRLRHKNRHCTTRKRRSTLSSTSLERLVRKRLLKSATFFTSVIQLLVFYLVHLLRANNGELAFSMLHRSCTASLSVSVLICARSAHSQLVWPVLRKCECCSTRARKKNCDFGGFSMLDFIFYIFDRFSR